MVANAGESAGNQREHQERHNELEKQIGAQEIRIQNLQSSAFQLANYFFVFQGVVVAAVSNNSSLTCSDAWFIFSLSFLAASLNLFALFSIATKYIRAMALHEQTWFEYNRTAVLLHRNRPEPFTRAFSSRETAINNNNNNNNDNHQWRDRLAQMRRYAVLAVCMTIFVAFAAVTLAGPWVIACKRDHRLTENRRRSHGSDCLRVCDESRRCMFFCKDL